MISHVVCQPITSRPNSLFTSVASSANKSLKRLVPASRIKSVLRSHPSRWTQSPSGIESLLPRQENQANVEHRSIASSVRFRDDFPCRVTADYFAIAPPPDQPFSSHHPRTIMLRRSCSTEPTPLISVRKITRKRRDFLRFKRPASVHFLQSPPTRLPRVSFSLAANSRR